MCVVVFGATGMVGQGVLRECRRDPQVTRVPVVGPRPVLERGDIAAVASGSGSA